jgi:uncharacterized protein with von Willebrand factor type A (vWA) domain
VPGALLNNLLVFGRLLRALGLDVHLGRLIDAADALQHIDIGSRDDVYHTLRALLVHRHEHLSIYDQAFAAFWNAGGLHAKTGASAQMDARTTMAEAGA